MQFLTFILSLTAFTTMCAAVPADQPRGLDISFSPDSTESSLVKRGTAQATSWSGGNCGGSSAYYSVSGSGFTCWTIRGAGIQLQGSGCTTTTWSGTNCGGSSFVVPDSNCHAVQFASVSFKC